MSVLSPVTDNCPSCYFVHNAFHLFNTEQNHKESDAIITYAYFDIILTEMSPVGAFLRRVFYGWGQYEKKQFRYVTLTYLNVT